MPPSKRVHRPEACLHVMVARLIGSRRDRDRDQQYAVQPHLPLAGPLQKRPLSVPTLQGARR